MQACETFLLALIVFYLASVYMFLPIKDTLLLDCLVIEEPLYNCEHGLIYCFISPLRGLKRFANIYLLTFRSYGAKVNSSIGAKC